MYYPAGSHTGRSLRFSHRPVWAKTIKRREKRQRWWEEEVPGLREVQPCRQVGCLAEKPSVLEPIVGIISKRFPEERGPEALERFFHSH